MTSGDNERFQAALDETDGPPPGIWRDHGLEPQRLRIRVSPRSLCGNMSPAPQWIVYCSTCRHPNVACVTSLPTDMAGWFCHFTSMSSHPALDTRAFMHEAFIGVLQTRLSELFPSVESQLGMSVDAPASSSATTDQLSASSGGPTHQSVPDGVDDIVDARSSSMAEA